MHFESQFFRHMFFPVLYAFTMLLTSVIMQLEQVIAHIIFIAFKMRWDFLLSFGLSTSKGILHGRVFLFVFPFDTIPLHLLGSLSFFIELYVFLWIMKTFSAFPVVLLLWWLCEYVIFFSLFLYVVGAIFSIRFESNVASVATAVATIVSSIRAYFCISFVGSLSTFIFPLMCFY